MPESGTRDLRESVTLRCAIPGDLPEMLAIFVRAFADDEHTQLKIAWRGAASMRDGLAAALEGWLASPVATLLVAIDPTSQVVGWACWARFGREHMREDPGEKVDSVISPIEALERHTDDDLRGCLNEVLARHGVVDVLVSIAVDPSAQGRGVGSELVRWGVRRADSASRVCWVHASESGARLAALHGFVLHRELVVDLAPFAPRSVGQTWGIVRFRSMTRSPGLPPKCCVAAS